jgi:chain length determinant protein tyrosine kinase EpsG
MAKFRDSAAPEVTSPPEQQAASPASFESIPPTVARIGTGGRDSAVLDRSIGDIIAEMRNLSAEQVEAVLAYQRTHGVRFGEAAVALKLVTQDDVMMALAEQFHYPYAPEEQRKLSPELVVLNQPFGVQAEAFRAMRSQMITRVFGESQPRRALAVISPDSKDGKTFFAANLAVALAQLGGRTLLVDADLRDPRQHEVFRLENRAGLSGILSGRSDSHVIQQLAAVPSLFVLPLGATPPNPQELVERPAFGLLMRELTSKFDHVVVDTPAFSRGSDATVIAARCGAALVVARRNASRVDMLQDLVANLAGTPARVAGVVMNEY